MIFLKLSVSRSIKPPNNDLLQFGNNHVMKTVDVKQDSVKTEENPANNDWLMSSDVFMEEKSTVLIV